MSLGDVDRVPQELLAGLRQLGACPAALDPTQPGLYAGLAADPRVLRVLALSGGYSRDEACALLARDPSLIASFSRALLEGLTESQTDEEFNGQLDSSIEQIYQASVVKQPAR